MCKQFIKIDLNMQKDCERNQRSDFKQTLDARLRRNKFEISIKLKFAHKKLFTINILKIVLKLYI